MLATGRKSALRQAIADDGFVVVADVLPIDVLESLRRAIDELDRTDSDARARRHGAVFACRNLFDAAPKSRLAADLPQVRELVEIIVGQGALVTRAILFDKNPLANWSVPWHQDTTIAVRARPGHAVPGFGPWSIKSDVVHVQPPAAVLEGMLTMRLHLDECATDNAPLRVVPGSHRRGILDCASAERERARSSEVACTVAAGGALLMRPLLLHASAPASAPARRRVIHLEWASRPLPLPLEWRPA